MIDRATVDKITEAANIVDVVSEFVTLRRSGANYKGLCPFHDDKTPSFYVSPARNLCKCFACGKGGTPVGFIMEHEQLTYPEALKWLARKYNIEVRERELTDEERVAQSERESMFIVNEWAAKYFEDTLHDTADGVAIGMQYFRSRGFRDDIIRKFRLGFDLQDRRALPQAATKAGYRKDFLVKTGLCYEREGSGDMFDRFAGRVIFPWMSVGGKVVGFGGRLLDQRTKGVAQKYVNSPDSDIYHKERELYGIFQAKRAIAKENRVYMVEGYTDVIAMHQCGIENVVANSGTALSMHQVRMLHRFTNNIVLLYDGDEAGIHAALRGIDMLLAEGMNVKVLLFPDGDDPDSFARKHTAAEFTAFIEQRQTDVIQFKTDVMLRGVADPVKRSEAINSIVKSISVIPDQIKRATYITDCSQRLSVNEATLISTMNAMIRSEREQKRRTPQNATTTDGKSADDKQQATPSDNTKPSPTPQTRHDTSSVEALLIRMVIRHGEQIIYNNVETSDGRLTDISVAQYIAIDLANDNLTFSDDLYQRILDEACSHAAEPGFNAAAYFTNHPDQDISSTAADMLMDRVQLTESLRMNEGTETLRNRVAHLVLDFKMGYINSRMRALQADIARSAADTKRCTALMQEYKELQGIRSKMARELRTEIII